MTVKTISEKSLSLTTKEIKSFKLNYVTKNSEKMQVNQ